MWQSCVLDVISMMGFIIKMISKLCSKICPKCNFLNILPDMLMMDLTMLVLWCSLNYCFKSLLFECFIRIFTMQVLIYHNISNHVYAVKCITLNVLLKNIDLMITHHAWHKVPACYDYYAGISDGGLMIIHTLTYEKKSANWKS